MKIASWILFLLLLGSVFSVEIFLRCHTPQQIMAMHSTSHIWSWSSQERCVHRRGGCLKYITPHAFFLSTLIRGLQSNSNLALKIDVVLPPVNKGKCNNFTVGLLCSLTKMCIKTHFAGTLGNTNLKGQAQKHSCQGWLDELHVMSIAKVFVSPLPSYPTDK